MSDIDYIKANFFKDKRLVKNSYRHKKHDVFFVKLETVNLGIVNRSELIFNTLKPGERNTCLECGSKTKFRNVYEGYNPLCSLKCLRINSDVNASRVNAIRKTLTEEHGVKNVMQIPRIKNKVIKTMNDRYGKSWFFETEEFQKKVIETSQKKYKTNHPLQNADVKLQRKKMFMDVYNRKSPRKFFNNREKRKIVVQSWCENMNIVTHDFDKFDINVSMQEQSFHFSHACGYSWVQDIAARNPLCEVCHKGSKVENSFKEWIISLGIDFIAHDRLTIRPLEIDVLFPAHRIGVEINGLYWRKDEAHGASVLDKTDMCADNNVQLISIWEHELAGTNSNKIKNMLKVKLGQSRLDVKNLKIRQLTLDEEKTYLNNNHIENYVKSSYSFGLVDENNHIHMSISIKKNRHNNTYKLTRMCSLAHIDGGLATILSYINQHILKTDERILLDCNRRFSNGEEFLVAGCSYVNISAPTYVWWSYKTFIKGGVMFRNNIEKFLGEKYNPALSERENMNANGWSRLTDAGNLRFVYKKR